MQSVFGKMLKKIIGFMLYEEKIGDKMRHIYLEDIGLNDRDLKFRSFDMYNGSHIRTSESTSSEKTSEDTSKSELEEEMLKTLFTCSTQR